MRIGAALALAAIGSACTPAPALPRPLPRGDAPTAVVVPSPSGAPSAPLRAGRFELALTDRWACVRVEGRVHCGEGKTRALVDEPAIEGIEGATSLVAGLSFACALVGTGDVRCFGENDAAQLGGGLREVFSAKAAPVLNVHDARVLAAGGDHACVLREGGAVTCWGASRSGEIGSSVVYTEAAVELARPVDVVGLAGATELHLAERLTCARLPGQSPGDLACVGLQGPDVFWSPGTTLPGRPRVLGLRVRDASSIAFHGSHGCVAATDRVTCAGDRTNLFPHPTPKDAARWDAWSAEESAPVTVPLPDVVRVVTGGTYACALRRGGSVACWGRATDGALGRPNPTGVALPPEDLAGLPPMHTLHGTEATVCATTDGATEAFCWGLWPQSFRAPSRTEPDDRVSREQHTPRRLRVFD